MCRNGDGQHHTSTNNLVSAIHDQVRLTVISQVFAFDMTDKPLASVKHQDMEERCDVTWFLRSAGRLAVLAVGMALGITLGGYLVLDQQVKTSVSSEVADYKQLLVAVPCE